MSIFVDESSRKQQKIPETQVRMLDFILKQVKTAATV